MGKKRKRGYPDIEETLDRTWCYYCERDFEDIKLLINHQKAKHFKCDRCGRRLNTAGGLSVHMNQVHKETLSQVENALPNRQGLDVEIFGMEGIPMDILEQHRNRIVQNFYQAQEDRRIATGNVQPGQREGGNGQNSPRKKIRYETVEELKARLAIHRETVRARMAAAERSGPSGEFQKFPSPGFPQQSSSGPYPTSYAPPNLPARPNVPPPGLPQRPSYPGNHWQEPLAAAAGVEPPGDDIDQLIRMAEAGIRPPARAAAADEGGEKKTKKDKDKNTRMVYHDPEDLSPEERMAGLPRYAFAPA